MDKERETTILDILRNLNLDGLKRLFWQELNYDRENKSLSPRQWPDSVRSGLDGDPILFAGGGQENAFHVVYCRLTSDTLSRGLERPIINQLLREHPYSLFVFSNNEQTDWHFVNVKHDDTVEKRRVIRRITVGPAAGLRTAAERIQLLDLADIGRDLFGSVPPLAIQNRCDEAFDVESVTKQFYQELANWYFWARRHAIFPKDAPVDADGKPSLPLIRLITRLIFCWFVRIKHNPETGEGLLPDALFEPAGIRGLLKDPSEESGTYYTAILQNLFFATLNTEMDKPGGPSNRRFINQGDGQHSDDHMVHTVWRHAAQLRDPRALADLLRTVPFLNGGLFECLDERVPKGKSPYTEEVRIDGFSSDVKKQPRLPNFLFFGADRTADLSEAYGDSSHQRETVRPLLSILRHYNFTLTENTPLEQEVALDPELLGHVFENLLAAYNPETGTVARKATGSFYTPRVVVDWMVDQTLLVYLQEKTGRTDADYCSKLRLLLSWEDEKPSFNPSETESLIDAVDRLKVLDPACGSGAFPMGMLQKLAHVLRKLDPENKGWRRRQEKALEAMESAPVREEAQRTIERAFARDNDDYGRKLYLIENCLYGVDIQPIACQIAKLRFFISLIVDQATDSRELNYGILPLPNLETKIVAANTLLGLDRGQLVITSQRVHEMEEELRQVRHDYFTARRYRDKKNLKARDRQLCAELATTLSESGGCSRHDSKRLAEWNPYDTNRDASFFDPVWMFGLSKENQDAPFDIVIGNPPYVRQEELKKVAVPGSNGKNCPLKDVLKDKYDCYAGTADLYVYFFERSLQLLRKGGVLSFITSNKYFRAAYGERLRTYLVYATRPRVVLDFGDAPVFTSIAYPCIVVTQKTKNVDLHGLPGKLFPAHLGPADWQSRVLTWTPGQALDDFPEIFEQQASWLSQRDLKPEGWQLESPAVLRLLEKLRRAGKPLGEYVNGRFYYGIKTGLNEAFVVDRATRDRLIAEHKSSVEVLKPFLRGRDVKRWRVDFAGQYLIKIESSENKEHPWTDRPDKEAEKIFAKTYPAIHARFEKYRDALLRRQDQGKYFWELRSCAYWQEFEKSSMIYPELALNPQYAFSDKGYISDCTLYITPIRSMFLPAMMNSRSATFLFSQISPKVRGGYMRFKHQYVEQIPIPTVPPGEQRVLEGLVNRILKAKQADPAADVTGLEREIDRLVYNLYGLTPEEIKIVESL